jgi:hypothetical protein
MDAEAQDSLEQMRREISFIRALTQGEGLTVEAIIREKPSDIYPDTSPEELVDMITWAADQLMDTAQTNAIRNALGLGDFKGGTLTERRNAFLKLADVSLRTLIRHEQSGADMLVHQLIRGRALQGQKPEPRIAQLQQQIHDLQILVARLAIPETRQSEWLVEAGKSAERRVVEQAELAAGMQLLVHTEAADVSLHKEDDS